MGGRHTRSSTGGPGTAPRDSWAAHPLTEDRWPDLERLFGPSGAYSSCWCMFWRVSRAEFSANGNRGNRRALRGMVQSGRAPGLIGYLDGEPAGWISLDRREEYPSLERSRVLKRVDDKPVWSIVCFFIAKPFRRRGVMGRLIESGVDHARSQGATTVEAYPTRWKDPASTYMGLVSEFEQHGFRMVRSDPRPLMRRRVRPRQPARASQKSEKAST